MSVSPTGKYNVHGRYYRQFDRTSYPCLKSHFTWMFWDIMSRQDHLQIIKNTDLCEMAQSSYPYIHTLQHLIIIMQSVLRIYKYSVTPLKRGHFSRKYTYICLPWWWKQIYNYCLTIEKIIPFNNQVKQTHRWCCLAAHLPGPMSKQLIRYLMTGKRYLWEWLKCLKIIYHMKYFFRT